MSSRIAYADGTASELLAMGGSLPTGRIHEGLAPWVLVARLSGLYAPLQVHLLGGLVHRLVRCRRQWLGRTTRADEARRIGQLDANIAQVPLERLNGLVAEWRRIVSWYGWFFARVMLLLPKGGNTARVRSWAGSRGVETRLGCSVPAEAAGQGTFAVAFEGRLQGVPVCRGMSGADDTEVCSVLHAAVQRCQAPPAARSTDHDVGSEG
jgi:hypothetical protein